MTETLYDLVEKKIKKRLAIKKIINMVICMAIFVLGVFATIYKVNMKAVFLHA